jgi:predicted DCC family thiol-disulfide oxidoreductase YuxK
VNAAPIATPRHLIVYFDNGCGICRRIAGWLARQPKFVPVYTVPAQDAGRSCPLRAEDLLREITVMSAEGAIWRGTDAWITCLWALRRYRGWALRLARPALKPWAERLFGVVAGLRNASLRRR